MSAASAPAWNRSPSTEALSSSHRPSPSIDSNLAANNALTAGGTSSTVIDPWSSSSANICSTNSGTPCAASTIRWRTSGASDRCSNRSSSMRSTSSSESEPRRTESELTLPPPQPGRRSSNSGRARHSSRTGPSRSHSDRYSMRSSSVGSAQWTSSNTTTNGWIAARLSNTRRSAQNVSSPAPEASPSPNAADTSPAIRAPSGFP